MANHPTDIHVGLRVRQRRALLGMSQTALANAVGLTFQQIQKYERGTNRASAGRLFEFSRVLDVPVSYFFEGLDGAKRRGRPSKEDAEQANQVSTKRETLELVRAYYKIRRSDLRDRIRRMIEEVARG